MSQELLKSVCRLYTKTPTEGGHYISEANAAFISPTHILTTAHNLEGPQERSVIAANHALETASIKNTIAKDTELDLAIVELSQPIGQGNWLPMVQQETLNEESAHNAYLAACFEEKAIYEQTTESYAASQQMWRDNIIPTHKMAFQTAARAQPGFSGAPIIKDGKIVSILLQVAFTQEQMDIIDAAGFQATEDTEPRTIIGPTPEVLAEFAAPFHFLGNEK